MINYTNFFNTLLTALNQSNIDGTFIRAYPNANNPPYPYCEINITTPFITESENVNALTDYISTSTTLTERRTEQSTLECSFNFMSNDQTQVLRIMSETREYLEFIGYDFLAENGIIKIDISGSQDRTAIFVTEYEFKYGFDVEFRVEDVSTNEVNFIETVEYQITHN